MEGKHEHNSTDEIEITQEMMEAGARILLLASGYSIGDGSAELFSRDIFLAMIQASVYELCCSDNESAPVGEDTQPVCESPHPAHTA